MKVTGGTLQPTARRLRQRLPYLYGATTLLIFQRSRRVACRNEIISIALIFAACARASTSHQRQAARVRAHSRHPFVGRSNLRVPFPSKRLHVPIPLLSALLNSPTLDPSIYLHPYTLCYFHNEFLRSFSFFPFDQLIFFPTTWYETLRSFSQDHLSKEFFLQAKSIFDIMIEGKLQEEERFMKSNIM